MSHILTLGLGTIQGGRSGAADGDLRRSRVSPFSFVGLSKVNGGIPTPPESEAVCEIETGKNGPGFVVTVLLSLTDTYGTGNSTLILLPW